MHHEIAEMEDQIGQQTGQIASFLGLPAHVIERLRRFSAQNRSAEGTNAVVAGQTEDIEHVLLGDAVATEGDELIEHRLGITHPTVRAHGNGVSRKGLEFHLFQFRNVLKMLRNERSRNLPEIEALAAAQNGWENLVRLGGCKDELHMRRRFLERLQERIEGTRAEHMNLVDVVDPELAAGRRIVDALPQRADVVHAVVGGTVDFRDIKTATLGDFHTDILVRIEIDLRTARAVERLRKNPARTRFSGASGPHKEIGMRQPVLRDGIPERPDHVILPENIIERLRSVLAGENLVLHGSDGTRIAEAGNGELPAPRRDSSGHRPDHGRVATTR